MKVTVIGTPLCPDTVDALAALRERGVDFCFKNISEDLAALKGFCKIRDSCPLFDAVRADDSIGIPVFLLEDGSITLDLEQVLSA